MKTGGMDWVRVETRIPPRGTDWIRVRTMEPGGTDWIRFQTSILKRWIGSGLRQGSLPEEWIGSGLGQWNPERRIELGFRQVSRRNRLDQGWDKDPSQRNGLVKRKIAEGCIFIKTSFPGERIRSGITQVSWRHIIRVKISILVGRIRSRLRQVS